MARVIADYKRRSHVIGLRIRQQQWELEAVRARAYSAREACRQATESLSQVGAVIDAAEAGLREKMSASMSLDPEQLRNTAHFLEGQQEIRRQRVTAHRRADQTLSRSEDRLDYEARVLKALKGVKEGADRQVFAEQEKQQAALAEDLWLQRWGREE